MLLSHRTQIAVLTCLSVIAGSGPLLADASADTTERSLEQRFEAPPPEAKPRVWWHWMDGNVSDAGIVADLSWMERAGIGGVQVFDGSLHTPQIVEKRIPFGSQPWRDAIGLAVTEAENRNLEFTIASSPGWSETGGPWVEPEQAMKKLVWSEAEITGGKAQTLRLPSPPSISGPFLEIRGGGAEPSGEPPSDLPALYRDSKVIAYRISSADRIPSPFITASADFDIEALKAGDRTHFQPLVMGSNGSGWLDFDYGRPVTLRAVELVLEPGPRIGPIYPSWPDGQIEASDDGQYWRQLATIPERGSPQQTVAFPATTAQHFRVRFSDRFAPFPVKAFAPPDRPVASHGIARINFVGEARVHRFEDKAGWSTVPGLAQDPTPDADAQSVIAKGDVIDLTTRMSSDGTLRWTAPPGRWRVLRIGWSLTGKLNNPASEEGTGLEVDKLSADHVRSYLDTYLRLYEEAVGADRMGRHGIQFMLNDSYEAMAANWTEQILQEFETRRGYDPLPWLPVLTGRVVENAQASDRFLWDFRRTLADLIAANHYGLISNELHARGLGRYGEAHEALRAFVGDGIEVKKSADVPMGATWAMPNASKLLPDILESASVAHLYGQNLVAAESFTAIFPSYGFDPSKLKPIADKMMANGVNRFVIHTSTHQPTDKPGPGIGLGGVGQWFTRKETWAEMAKPWMDYLARSSFMLQQGRFVADVAWFYGEDDNITAVFDGREPAMPDGYAFDFINADAIRTVLEAQDGSLSTPGGARYRLIVIDPSARFTLPTLRKLDELSRQGAVIVGSKPVASPSLADDQREFSRIASAIWRRDDRTFASLDEALMALGLAPDVQLGDENLSFVHRSLPGKDLYFVANLGSAQVSTTASFRVKGKAAEIWRADTGAIERASYRIIDGRTEVPLVLGPHEAAFVVFREPTAKAVYHAPSTILSSIATLEGPWLASFPGSSGEQHVVELSSLVSWSKLAEPELRYFSGTARYSTDFEIDGIAGIDRILLDLGEVANLARVIVNETDAGITWKVPYRIDVTDFVRPGKNKLEIEVANLWPNRLIGDRQSNSERPPVEAAFNPFTAESPLQQSGLLGPVRLIRAHETPGRPEHDWKPLQR